MRLNVPGKRYRHVLAIAGIVLVCATLQTGADGVTPPVGMISWWRAEGNAEDTIGSNHGTPVNGAGFASGNVGEAFDFDGVNQAVVIPRAPSLNPTLAITLECWVYPRRLSISFGQDPVSKDGEGFDRQYLLRMGPPRP